MNRRPPAARTSASDRVARLLAIVPWVAAHDGPTVDEISRRFGIDRRKLLEDLDVLMMVGVPPYTPDTLIDVTIDGDRVWLRFADVFSRPLHLTPEQGLALVAAGSASLDLEGGDRDGPLARALAKLAGVLGVAVDEAVSVRLGETRPGLLDTLRAAVEAHRRLRIDYYAYGRDERTTRDVDPHAVVAEDGALYLHAYCHRAQGWRSFRVDRIVEAVPLDETFEPAAGDDDGGGGTRPATLVAGPEVPRVALEVEPGARWIVDTYPVDGVEPREDGWLRVRLPVTATPWLERLLVRLGDGARLVEADDPALLAAGTQAARRILARYGIGPVARAPR